MAMPLDGIRVLDHTIWQAGPVATEVLADLGADVVKLEEPKSGDPGRYMRTTDYDMGEGRSLYFESFNRNKQSMTLNLKSPEGRHIFDRLTEAVDVYVTNMSSAALKGLRLDYKSLTSRNPRLIFAHITGFGPRGPRAHLGAFAPSAEAYGGYADLCRFGDEQPRLAWGFADQLAGLVTATAILTALLTRERFGVGQEIDTSLLGAQVWFGGASILSHSLAGKIHRRSSRDEYENPLINCYRTQDGAWLQLSMVRHEPYWEKFCRTVGLEQLLDDPRFNKDQDSRSSSTGHGKELTKILDAHFATRPGQVWETLLTKADIPAALVHSYTDLADDEQVRVNGYVTEFTDEMCGRTLRALFPASFSWNSFRMRNSAPNLGQDTEDVLWDWGGYTMQELAEFRQKGVI